MRSAAAAEQGEIHSATPIGQLADFFWHGSAGYTGALGRLARNRFRDLMDIQIVAFPQEGIVKSPGTKMVK